MNCSIDWRDTAINKLMEYNEELTYDELKDLASGDLEEMLLDYEEPRDLVEIRHVENVRQCKDFSDKSIKEIEKQFKVKHIETFFVDSSGFGRESEPALTYPSFLKRLEALKKKNKKLYGALTGIGQFQVYVSIFK